MKEKRSNNFLNIHQQEVKKRIKINNWCLLIFFVAKIVVVFLIVFFIIIVAKEMKEYKEVFFTYNAMEQLENMFRGKFVLISPSIEINEENTTPNRCIHIYG